MTPVKYGQGLNAYREGCIINIDQEDGTVTVTTSGSEVGQGLNTKVAQAVAMSLGVPLSTIVVTSNATDRIANADVTGGSGTSESCVAAALDACTTMNARLAPVKDAHPTASWPELIGFAYAEGIALTATGYFQGAASPYPFTYFVWAAAATKIELDVLTGQIQILRTDIVYDCGQSLSPEIDMGQIEGAFVMGLGFMFTEEAVVMNTGALANPGTWDYKPPASLDIPISFNVTFLEKTPNPLRTSVLGSKCVAEPPYQLAASAYFAVCDAINAARSDAGETGPLQLCTPITVERIQRACLVSASQFNLDAASATRLPKSQKSRKQT